MATNTTNYNFTLPGVADPVDADEWGTQLNGNWTSIDGLLLAASNTVSRALSANTTLTSDDRNKLILVDATSGPITITLLASPDDGFTVAIKKTDSSTNAVTVNGNGNNIDGSSTHVLPAENNAAIYSSDSAGDYFINASAIAASFSSLSDTNFTSLSTNQFARYDGTEWVNVGGSGPTIQVFTSGGTWNRPSGCIRVKATVVGGGGGGAGNSTSITGGGGGGGGTAIEYIDVTGTASETVTIGAGGAGGAGGNGTAGGTSSFGAFCSADGGSPGQNQRGGAGGSGSGGDINLVGSDGHNGEESGNGNGGNGGSSTQGGGGRGGCRPTGNAALGGNNYGGGGGGDHFTSNAGGSGAGGIVIVEEYYV